MSNSLIADHFFCLTQLIEKMTLVNTELHILYVDLQKAHDSISLNKLLESLKSTNINTNLIKVVLGLYDECQVQVKIGNKLWKEFRPNKGLKQGCCVSPIHFFIFLENSG